MENTYNIKQQDSSNIIVKAVESSNITSINNTDIKNIATSTNSEKSDKICPKCRYTENA